MTKERYKLDMTDPQANAHHALLSARKISISRGMMPVLAGFDLDMNAGQAVVITGPNGSGKTTLLRGLALESDGNLDLPVIIVADSQASHQSVVTAMDAIGQAGFAGLSIATQRSEQSGAQDTDN